MPKAQSKSMRNRDAKQAARSEKLTGKAYERELARLHGELVKLQIWVVDKGLKVCVLFEGRDGAGKGGVIKAITERVSPRVFRVVALPAPTDRPGKVADVYPALHSAHARRRRDRDL
jgi:polyphosphate kinase